MIKNKGIILSILIIVLVFISTITATYSVFVDEEVNDYQTNLSLKDLITDDNGIYNDIYYIVKDKLDISDSDALILINSNYLELVFQELINNIYNYRLGKSDKITKEKLSNMIKNATLEDDTIYEELKEKVINNSDKYISNILNYLSSIEIDK